MAVQGDVQQPGKEILHELIIYVGVVIILRMVK